MNCSQKSCGSCYITAKFIASAGLIVVNIDGEIAKEGIDLIICLSKIEVANAIAEYIQQS